jgi:hypothetical protein
MLSHCLPVCMYTCPCSTKTFGAYAFLARREEHCGRPATLDGHGIHLGLRQALCILQGIKEKDKKQTSVRKKWCENISVINVTKWSSICCIEQSFRSPCAKRKIYLKPRCECPGWHALLSVPEGERCMIVGGYTKLSRAAVRCTFCFSFTLLPIPWEYSSGRVSPPTAGFFSWLRASGTALNLRNVLTIL